MEQVWVGRGHGGRLPGCHRSGQRAPGDDAILVRGSPSLEQLAFEYQLGIGHDPGRQPNVAIRLVSRLFDVPRIVVNHFLS